MDGLPHSLPLHIAPTIQRTLKASIGCVGVGLHSGRRVQLDLLPAPVGTGIVFRRTDLGVDIPARYDHVIDTRLCTVLGLPGRPEARVATVEHVMAALAGAGVHNAIVAVDGPEVPIHDGSSASALFLIDCAGIVEQAEFIPAIEVLRPVRVEHGEAFAELRPFPFAFDMAMSIAFDAAAIGRQALTLRLTPESFRTELARARTFTMASEVEQMRAAGLALGGSLDNAVVVDGATVLNPAGLRMRDEFVRHKLLDAVGDLALAGAPLRGRFVGHRTGHALNNRLLRALFADAANWRFLPASDAVSRPAPVALPAPRVRQRARAVA
jgi:UDP-3-O-[3-hydroxymyristoyl] N-acetylglucosamine deacetylase